jgi:quercetin dioxygenase-like cupin family protein
MMAMTIKSFDRPDETMSFPKGQEAKVKVGDTTVSRTVLEPGWRWSVHVKDMAGTASCVAPHTLYVVSGRLGARMDDGAEGEVGPGEVAWVPAGHDGWVVGAEPCVVLDFTGADEFGKAH